MNSPLRALPIVGVLLAVAAPVLTAQTITVQARPATASIWRLKIQDNSLEKVADPGQPYRLKIEKNDPNTIVVRQDGFRDVRRSFPKDAEKYNTKEPYSIFLTRRVVELTVLPYDATIFVNGEARGQRSHDLEVEEGTAQTVEIRRTGLAPVTRVYRWDKGTSEYPPARERIELSDRRVLLTASQSGAEFFKNDAKLGDNDADVVIPRGSCVIVRAQKPGFAAAERQYCNKEGMPDPPVSDRLVLAGRVVSVNAATDAKIFVNNKQAGVGSYPVKVPDGQCVLVRVEQPAFLPWEREYCAQDNAPVPPIEQLVQLKADESFSASVASDQANVNVTFEVNTALTDLMAWKRISSIVLSHFDVLENSDSETGYLRTAWQIKSYGDNNEVVIRTRVIVKRASESPLRYTMKIVSERNKMAGVSVKEDENFVPWDRLLNTYKDVIGEMQARLK
ncbi:MAG: hypothetical protein ACK5ZZ_00580 [Gemmatimonadaceae bacterium]|jgi:hypothetical protein